MSPLEHTVDRLWSISLGLAPVALVVMLILWRSRSPALRHRMYVTLLFAHLLPLILPVLRDVFVFEGADPRAVPTVVTVMTRSSVPVWLAVTGTAAIVIVRVVTFLAVERSLRPLRPAPAGFASRLATGRERLGVRRGLGVAFTAASRGPALVGLLRPRLVIPDALWDHLDHDAREALILHELAHLRRRDHVALLLANLVTAVFWWNPVVWLLARRAAADRELACDALVVASGTDPERYAETLLRVQQSAPVAAALGAGSRTFRQLERRLEAVFGDHRRPPGRWSLLAVALLLAVTLSSTRGASGVHSIVSVPLDDAALRSRLSGTSSSEERRRLVDALGNLGPAALGVRGVVEHVRASDPSPRVRRVAADALLRIDSR